MARLQTITFTTESGQEQSLKAQDVTVTDDLEYYNTQYDESISGSLRSNLRGVRKNISISYKLCTEPDTYREICNNILTDFENGNEFFYVSIDSDGYLRVILDSDLAYTINYANQHGLFVPRLSLRAQQLNAEEDLDIEDWRFVYESITEARNYGLITESVTAQLDYGTIV